MNMVRNIAELSFFFFFAFVPILTATNAGAAAPANHNNIFSGLYFHPPVADEDCTVCHTIHGDAVGPFLQAEVPELCYECHEDKAAMDMVHEPVGEGECLSCHDPHTSDSRPLLIKRVPELCHMCHDPDDEHIAKNAVCNKCHNVHSSGTARFLKGERTKNCWDCHDDKRKGESLHTPAKEGKCMACHYTHPDPRFVNRIRASYPLKIRTPYEPGAYALCERCHKPAIFNDINYFETGFRTVSQNLHARHVFGKDGVTCSACHDIHNARRPGLIVEFVRIKGESPQPLNYLKFTGGGTCGDACHEAKTYVQNEELIDGDDEE